MAPTPSLLAGRYEVGELLGRGGMAEVHRGVDTRLGRTVAVKVLRSDLASDPAFQTRFRREAQSAASLNHPAVVAVYDTGEDLSAGSRVPFIVMEHVQGQTLREVLHARGGAHDDERAGDGDPVHAAGLDPAEAVQVTAAVLDALEYSHRAGIVHRDIKPANVMLTASGQVKVMDFGIARALADAAATVTQAQAVVGTAQYLSPEQARGETVDARSDLYSTGCLLYELLTGRPPFVGDSAVSVAYQHVRETAPPPSVLAPHLPEALDRVVMKALAKDREDRYPDAAAFRDDLRAAAGGGRVAAPALDAAAGATATRVVPAAGEAFQARTSDPTRTVTIGRVEEPDEPRRRRAGAYVLLALAVLAVFVLAAFGVSRLLAEPDTTVPQVQVPSVVDATREQARADLEAAGLVYAERTRQDDADEGTVVDQSPTGGATVDEGETVTVTVSTGPGQVTVPDVRGQDQGLAAQSLRDAGLRVGEVSTQDDPDVPGGGVIDSDPGAGTDVAPGTAVDLLVSSGEVDLPDLTGEDYRDAREEVIALGLDAVVEFVEDEADQDEVIRQDPAAGSVPQGTVVTLVASQQVEPEPTQTEPTEEPTQTEPAPTQTQPTDPAPTDTATQTAPADPGPTDPAPTGDAP